MVEATTAFVCFMFLSMSIPFPVPEGVYPLSVVVGAIAVVQLVIVLPFADL